MPPVSISWPRQWDAVKRTCQQIRHVATLCQADVLLLRWLKAVGIRSLIGSLKEEVISGYWSIP